MKPPFRRVLVANRGEIAVRIIRACRELGIQAVAVYSDADAAAPHVRLADEAVRLGPPAAGESYLRADRIVEAAVAHGADAVHPGYGFLSERADFAEACGSAGLVFVGPAPETLAGLGDKLAARRTARAVGAPVVPGTLEPVVVDHAAESDGIAAEIGWPLLIKAAGGGGGRGMRVVDGPDELARALRAASAEAAAAFGNGAVYLERHISGGRHVEVQLLGDAAGTVVAVGDRDCSVQRRHQKLVEEAPAPGLDPEERRTLHAHAVAIARAVGLRNAATAEFLFDGERRFWFLEVNARLQVEHGVTELVADVDLVREQLSIAAGNPISERASEAAARATEPGRHAIEVRISGEDPGRAFAPVFGRIARWREPGGPGVRVDSGVEEGSAVASEYDPLLAKLLVVDADRAAAIARLRRAILEFRVAGVQTTLAFHRWLVDAEPFVAGHLATDFVDRHWRPEPLLERAGGRAVRLAARHAESTGDRKAPGGRAPRAAPESPWWAAGLAEATDRWP